ncbi:hypothetical protein D3C86_1713420 [compost metagenome]
MLPPEASKTNSLQGSQARSERQVNQQLYAIRDRLAYDASAQRLVDEFIRSRFRTPTSLAALKGRVSQTP